MMGPRARASPLAVFNGFDGDMGPGLHVDAAQGTQTGQEMRETPATWAGWPWPQGETGVSTAGSVVVSQLNDQEGVVLHSVDDAVFIGETP